MNRKEAEDFIYKSYMKAEKNIDYSSKDCYKRHPELTHELIQQRSSMPAVLVTGSKGKGSVASMISQILSAKIKTGLMTSPHISSFCERFKVNGVDISDEDFAKHVSVLEKEIETIEAKIPENVYISPMGIQTLVALDYFKSQNTEANVFECGKGAKYDDVNNIVHQYSIINKIFLEHTRELGSTLAEIAEDKAYVITENQTRVYIAEQDSEVRTVLINRAESLGVLVKEYGKDFWAENIRFSKTGMLFDVVINSSKYTDILVPLMGEHQAENATLALAFCYDYFEEHGMAFDIDMIRDRLSKIQWPGRMEVISTSPFIMLDACINRESCKLVKEVLENLDIKDVTTIVGVPDDKDYVGVVKEMADTSSEIMLTKSSNSHYVFTDKQVSTLASEGIKVIQADSVEEALQLAKDKSNNIVILGTTSVVADVKKLDKSWVSLL
ncbi:MAG: bifunctional protein FolC [Eubacterium sp.]|nr:bifunctional protein FolC [Eubacterium sp.]